ncbi:MAG: hypothetical protein WCZ43_10700 [Proteiniphilum sp.]
MKINPIIILFTAMLLIVSSCKKEEIEVWNTQITPDLSNPIIQSVTNITWYRNINTTREEWVSVENIPKPSEAMASMLYQIAWVNFTLFRDGTSNMLFGFSINAAGLTYVGDVYDLPMRTQKNRYYVIEITRNESHGSWCRITTNNAVFYAFLFKTQLDLAETIDFKEAVRNWNTNN